MRSVEECFLDILEAEQLVGTGEKTVAYSVAYLFSKNL